MSRFASSVALAALVVVAACELETVNVPTTKPTVVVHAVLNPAATTQIVLLERTLTGAVHVPDLQFNANDPIVSAGGIPITGAIVEIIDSSGTPVRGIEDVTVMQNGDGRGVYRVPLVGGLLRLGQRYKLHVRTPQGEEVTAFTRLPAPELSSTRGLTQTFNRDHDTLNIAWQQADRTRAYAIRVESPYGPFFLFTDSLHVRLTGDLRNLFSNGLQHVLVPGFHQDVVVAAVDSNFFDYYRTNNDPFTGAGIINRINGGMGFFGSFVTLTNGTLIVIADQKQPIEGQFRVTTLGTNTTPAASFNLYIESPAANSTVPAALSGRWVTQSTTNPHGEGLIGTIKGTTVTIALLSNQLASDTVDVFDGQLHNDTLFGIFRKAGPANFAKQ